MLSDNQREEIRLKIQDLIIKSKQDIIEIEKMTEPVKPENSLGRISRMDAINNKSVMELALRNKKGKLTKLKVALTKIDDPQFGICMRCKQEIQTARLIYMPESSECINCASRQ